METIINVAVQLGGLAWGLIIKYHPSWKAWPNAAIPYLQGLVAFVASLAAASAAHAAIGDVAGGTHLYVLGILPVATTKIAGIGGAALSAAWTAIQNFLIYEVFLRHPLEKGAGWQKA